MITRMITIPPVQKYDKDAHASTPAHRGSREFASHKPRLAIVLESPSLADDRTREPWTTAHSGQASTRQKETSTWQHCTGKDKDTVYITEEQWDDPAGLLSTRASSERESQGVGQTTNDSKAAV
jgi:hypothetical protein